MFRNRGKTLAAATLSTLALGWWLLAAPPPARGEEPDDKKPKRYEVGDTVADYEMLGVDGKTVKLSTLKGKVVFLNFWASW